MKTDYKIIRMDYPARIPQREFTIYARKEPFVDPVDDSPSPKEETAFYRESYEREKPLPQEIEYSEKDWEIIRDFRGYISRALWNEVIPSLRQVSMQWDPEEKIMWILFYHDGPITDAIAEQYGYIDSLADCYPSLNVQTCYKMIWWIIQKLFQRILLSFMPARNLLLIHESATLPNMTIPSSIFFFDLATEKGKDRNDNGNANAMNHCCMCGSRHK